MPGLDKAIHVHAQLTGFFFAFFLVHIYLYSAKSRQIPVPTQFTKSVTNVIISMKLNVLKQLLVVISTAVLLLCLFAQSIICISVDHTQLSVLV